MAENDANPRRRLPMTAVVRAAPYMAPGCLLAWFAANGLVDDARGVILGFMASSLIFAGAAKALIHPDRSMLMLWAERGSTYVFSGIFFFVLSLPFLLLAGFTHDWVDRTSPALESVSGTLLLVLCPAPLIWRFWPALFVGFVADLSDGSYGVGKNRHVWSGPGCIAAFRATRIPEARPSSRIAFVAVYLCLILWIVILELTPGGDGPAWLRLTGPLILVPFLVAILTHESDFVWRQFKRSERENDAPDRSEVNGRSQLHSPPALPRRQERKPSRKVSQRARVASEMQGGLRFGTGPNATDHDGATALHIALRDGDKPTIRSLLKLDAKADVADRFNTQPMHMAALNKTSSAFIPELIRRGASVNVLDNNERTPLHNAVRASCLPAVRLLLQHGAEVGVGDRYGDTSMHMAANWTPRPSSDRPVQIRDQQNIIQCLVQAGLNINGRNKREETPLHRAARLGCPPIIDELVALGAALNPRDRDKISPLQAATANGKIENVQALLHHQAEMDVHTAVATGDLDFLKTHPTNVAGHKADSGSSLLPSLVGLAVHFDQEEVLDWLIEQGANVNGSAFSPTPLLHAVNQKKNAKLARKLLKAGADVDWPDGDLRTPLQYAASQGSYKLIHVLMEFGANPHLPPERGHKPIDATKDAKLIRLMKHGV